jgi:hypothetical protein
MCPSNNFCTPCADACPCFFLQGDGESYAINNFVIESCWLPYSLDTLIVSSGSSRRAAPAATCLSRGGCSEQKRTRMQIRVRSKPV